ncbi:hypothetical protein XELAEV_18033220mg [Xenopus laevis]|uniref:C-type lectin domain-containing protein n=1 Tax=Xenopus laevis TaxID=8355 RepID=A0A974CL88_XENLA|nr:hypothetical protein XELAEV_18033220mg [Xenopus laevis]
MEYRRACILLCLFCFARVTLQQNGKKIKNKQNSKEQITQCSAPDSNRTILMSDNTSDSLPLKIVRSAIHAEILSAGDSNFLTCPIDQTTDLRRTKNVGTLHTWSENRMNSRFVRSDLCVYGQLKDWFHLFPCFTLKVQNIEEEVIHLKEQQALQTICLKWIKIYNKCFLAFNPFPASHENDSLYDYVHKIIGSSTEIWLGINDMATEGTWQDLSQSPISFINWETEITTQPDGGKQENCAALSVAAIGKWFDKNCKTGGVAWMAE